MMASKYSVMFSSSRASRVPPPAGPFFYSYPFLTVMCVVDASNGGVTEVDMGLGLLNFDRYD